MANDEESKIMEKPRNWFPTVSNSTAVSSSSASTLSSDVSIATKPSTNKVPIDDSSVDENYSEAKSVESFPPSPTDAKSPESPFSPGNLADSSTFRQSSPTASKTPFTNSDISPTDTNPIGLHRFPNYSKPSQVPFRTNSGTHSMPFKPLIKHKIKLSDNIWITKKCTENLLNFHCSQRDIDVWRIQNPHNPTGSVHIYLNYKFAQHLVEKRVKHIYHEKEQLILFNTELKSRNVNNNNQKPMETNQNNRNSNNNNNNYPLSIFLVGVYRKSGGKSFTILDDSIYTKPTLFARYPFLKNVHLPKPVTFYHIGSVERKLRNFLCGFLKFEFPAQNPKEFWGGIRHKIKLDKNYPNQNVHLATANISPHSMSKWGMQQKWSVSDLQKAFAWTLRNIATVRVFPMLFIDTKQQKCYLEFLLPLCSPDIGRNSPNNMPNASPPPPSGKVIGLTLRMNGDYFEFQSLYYSLNQILNNMRLVQPVDADMIFWRSDGSVRMDRMNRNTQFNRRSNQSQYGHQRNPSDQRKANRRGNRRDQSNPRNARNQSPPMNQNQNRKPHFHNANNNNNNVNNNNVNVNMHLNVNPNVNPQLNAAGDRAQFYEQRTQFLEEQLQRMHETLMRRDREIDVKNEEIAVKDKEIAVLKNEVLQTIQFRQTLMAQLSTLLRMHPIQ